MSMANKLPIPPIKNKMRTKKWKLEENMKSMSGEISPPEDWEIIAHEIATNYAESIVYAEILEKEITDLLLSHEQKIREDQTKRIFDRISEITDGAKALGDNIEVAYGTRECRMCGYGPEHQREYLLKEISSMGNNSIGLKSKRKPGKMQ